METPIGDDDDSHLGDFIEDSANTAPMEAAMQAGLRDVVKDILDSLTPREAKVLRMRFRYRDDLWPCASSATRAVRTNCAALQTACNCCLHRQSPSLPARWLGLFLCPCCIWRQSMTSSIGGLRPARHSDSAAVPRPLASSLMPLR